VPSGSASPYGTFDQGGNVYQWNEQIGNGFGGPGSARGLRGGASVNGAGDLAASAVSDFGPAAALSYVGFRVVTFPDTDGDGIPDSFDNCPYTPNPNQQDSGGINTTVPDGIGDACQCGDVTGDGIVNVADKTILSRSLAGLGPYGSVAAMPGFDKCDVIDTSGTCTVSDKAVIAQAIAGLSPGIQQVCTAAICHAPEVCP